MDSLVSLRQCTRLYGMRVFHQPEAGVLWAERGDELCELRYASLVLATGARERFLPFPGWTLPNVMGAGALQAMVKSGLPIRGKRVVIAGTGPLLLAVAAFLRKHGAEIPAICEQASWSKLARFGASLIRLCRGRLLRRGSEERSPFGNSTLEPTAGPWRSRREVARRAVTIARGKAEIIRCDYLACGFHLVPNVGTRQALLGCTTPGLGMCRWMISANAHPRQGVRAGEPTGIGGVELAVVEG